MRHLASLFEAFVGHTMIPQLILLLICMVIYLCYTSLNQAFHIIISSLVCVLLRFCKRNNGRIIVLCVLLNTALTIIRLGFFFSCTMFGIPGQCYPCKTIV